MFSIPARYLIQFKVCVNLIFYAYWRRTLLSRLDLLQFRTFWLADGLWLSRLCVVGELVALPELLNAAWFENDHQLLWLGKHNLLSLLRRLERLIDQLMWIVLVYVGQRKLARHWLTICVARGLRGALNRTGPSGLLTAVRVSIKRNQHLIVVAICYNLIS